MQTCRISISEKPISMFFDRRHISRRSCPHVPICLRPRRPVGVCLYHPRHLRRFIGIQSTHTRTAMCKGMPVEHNMPRAISATSEPGSSSVIFPRRKAGQNKRPASQAPVVVTHECLEEVFDMPLWKACQRLGSEKRSPHAFTVIHHFSC
jgi:hypothetical protein